MVNSRLRYHVYQSQIVNLILGGEMPLFKSLLFVLAFALSMPAYALKSPFRTEGPLLFKSIKPVH